MTEIGSAIKMLALYASHPVQQPKPALSFNGVPIHLENSFLADEQPKPEGGAS